MAGKSGPVGYLVAAAGIVGLFAMSRAKASSHDDAAAMHAAIARKQLSGEPLTANEASFYLKVYGTPYRRGY